MPAAPALLCMQMKALILVLSLLTNPTLYSRALIQKSSIPVLAAFSRMHVFPESTWWQILWAPTPAPSMVHSVHSIHSCNRQTTPTWSIVGPLFHSSLARSLVKSRFSLLTVCECPNFCLPKAPNLAKQGWQTTSAEQSSESSSLLNVLLQSRGTELELFKEKSTGKFLCFLAQG